MTRLVGRLQLLLQSMTIQEINQRLHRSCLHQFTSVSQAGHRTVISQEVPVERGPLQYWLHYCMFKVFRKHPVQRDLRWLARGLVDGPPGRSLTGLLVLGQGGMSWKTPWRHCNLSEFTLVCWLDLSQYWPWHPLLFCDRLLILHVNHSLHVLYNLFYLLWEEGCKAVAKYVQVIILHLPTQGLSQQVIPCLHEPPNLFRHYFTSVHKL